MLIKKYALNKHVCLLTTLHGISMAITRPLYSTMPHAHCMIFAIVVLDFELEL